MSAITPIQWALMETLLWCTLENYIWKTCSRNNERLLLYWQITDLTVNSFYSKLQTGKQKINQFQLLYHKHEICRLPWIMTNIVCENKQTHCCGIFQMLFLNSLSSANEILCDLGELTLEFREIIGGGWHICINLATKQLEGFLQLSGPAVTVWFTTLFIILNKLCLWEWK